MASKELSETGPKRKFGLYTARGLTKTLHFDILVAIDGKWFGGDQPYITEDGFPNFHIVLDSLLYLGKMSNKVMTEEDVKEYFEKKARKQIGGHLFINSFGCLKMIYTTWISSISQYSAEFSSPINSIYPVLRNEDKSGEQALVMGLLFDTDKDHKPGRRLYHRFGYKWSKAGNVWEFTETLFEQKFIKNWHSFGDRPHFAIYVCSSAKLVVVDQYNELNKEGHTRCLIQPGGVVIVDGQLTFRINRLNAFYTMKDIITNRVLIGQKGVKVMEHKNPVLFLGANESEHNSICWELNVMKLAENNDRIITLLVPEGGRILALESWDYGIQEIWVRHKYERLFNSTVIHSNTEHRVSAFNFEIPSKDLMEKMLGIGQNRHIKCDIRKKLPANALKAEPTLPIESNFQNFLRLYPNITKISSESVSMTVSVPYPPMEYKIGNTVHYLYLPNNKEPAFLEEVESHYHWTKFNANEPEECVLQYNNRIFKLEKEKLKEINEYEWKKDMTAKREQCDGLTIRLGADGWLYRRTDKLIASFLTPVYYRYK